MAFPRRLLADHEQIVFERRPHWIELFPAALFAIVIILIWIAAYALTNDMKSADTIQNIIGIAAVVALAWLVVLPVLRWYFTLFVLTTDRIISRSGILAKRSKEIPLERINDVAFNQSVLERIVGAGDLLIESAGERGQERIANVRNPEAAQLAIYEQAEENSNRMLRPDSSQPTTIPDQLEALARLRDQGVLSPEEFETKKDELLRRM